MTVLESLVTDLEAGLDRASSLDELEELRVDFLGRKGKLAQAMSSMAKLPPAERPAVGQKANSVKERLTALFDARKTALEAAREAEALKRFDPSLPGRAPWRGSLHPTTLVMEEICGIFSKLGFDIASGPEVENDFYNFESLNMPPEHPARDMQDTLYITERVLMRTHTSPVQVRTMLGRKPPLAIVAPGKVYRRDSDLTHTPMFHQAVDNDPPRLAKIMGRIPAKTVGDPMDVGMCAAFLCSDAARYISGSCIPVDGGALIGF